MQNTHFIKPILKPGEDDIQLDCTRLAKNVSSGKRTAIQLDANMFISFLEHQSDPSSAGDNKLRDFGLYEFVELIRYCNVNQIPVSIHPGLALIEVIGDLQKATREYDRFFEDYSLGSLDNPEGRSLGPARLHDSECALFHLSGDELKFRAPAFLSILAMLMTENDENLHGPAQRIERYLKLMLEFVGVFSVKETLIAQLVLGDLASEAEENGFPFDENTAKFYSAIVSNFARRKKGGRARNLDDILRICFNAANDIAQVNMAILGDGRVIDGEKLDVWLATQDVKLARFLGAVSYRELIPGEKGMFAEVTLPSAIASHPSLIMMEAMIFAERHCGPERAIPNLSSDIWIVKAQQMIQIAKYAFAKKF